MEKLIRMFILMLTLVTINVTLAKAQLVDTTVTIESGKIVEFFIDPSITTVHILIVDTVDGDTVFCKTVTDDSAEMYHDTLVFGFSKYMWNSELISEVYFINNENIRHHYRTLYIRVDDVSSVGNIEAQNKERLLYKIYNMAGQEVPANNIPPMKPLIYKYEDGTSEIKSIIK